MRVSLTARHVGSMRGFVAGLLLLAVAGCADKVATPDKVAMPDEAASFVTAASQPANVGDAKIVALKYARFRRIRPRARTGCRAGERLAGDQGGIGQPAGPGARYR